MKREEAERALKEIEDLFRRGESARSQSLIREVARHRLARDLALSLANQARRGMLPQITVRLLHRWVRRTPKSSPQHATDMERSVYAAGLGALGGNREALRILSGVDVKEAPRALLYAAFCHFRLWEFEEAVAPLERLLRVPGLDEFDRLAAEMHLGNALVHGVGDYGRARELLTGVLKKAQAPELGVLRRTSLVILVQAETFSGRIDSARRYCEELADFHDKGDAHFRQRLGNWKAIIDRKSGKLDAAAFRRAMRESARGYVELRDWESARACDYQLALDSRDEALLTRLYFGTPSAGFRRRMARDAPWLKDLPPRFEWPVPPHGAASAARVSSWNGENDAGRAFLREGGVLQRLLLALSRDFYKPSTLAELFHELHPGLYFHPTSSPHRVYITLQRLRRWFRQAKLPLEITIDEGLVRLVSTSPCLVRVTPDGAPPPDAGGARVALRRLFEKAGRHFEGRAVSAGELAGFLKLPPRTALRHLRAAVEAGLVTRSGSARATRYRISPGNFR
jgi:tetratricopeptide (TPR) repeat protein